VGCVTPCDGCNVWGSERGFSLLCVTHRILSKYLALDCIMLYCCWGCTALCCSEYCIVLSTWSPHLFSSDGLMLSERVCSLSVWSCVFSQSFLSLSVFHSYLTPCTRSSRLLNCPFISPLLIFLPPSLPSSLIPSVHLSLPSSLPPSFPAILCCTDYDNVNISDLKKAKRRDDKKNSSSRKPKRAKDVSTL
jgi:hypothetical protein